MSGAPPATPFQLQRSATELSATTEAGWRTLGRRRLDPVRTRSTRDRRARTVRRRSGTMQDRQSRNILAFNNSLGFFDQYPIEPEPPILTGMRASLSASIDRFGILGREQQSAALDMNGDVEKRRRKLRREEMIPLARTAKPLLDFAPGVERALRVPHARADAQTVANAAMRMADVLKP